MLVLLLRVLAIAFIATDVALNATAVYPDERILVWFRAAWGLAAIVALALAERKWESRIVIRGLHPAVQELSEIRDAIHTRQVAPLAMVANLLARKTGQRPACLGAHPSLDRAVAPGTTDIITPLLCRSRSPHYLRRACCSRGEEGGTM